MSDKIKGVPEGYEFIEFRCPVMNETVIGGDGKPFLINVPEVPVICAIIRKVEKPKQYRPFANAEEFKPFRDQWVRCKGTGSCFKIIEFQSDDLYIGRGSTLFSWTEAFKAIVFDDGSAFGIEVAE